MAYQFCQRIVTRGAKLTISVGGPRAISTMLPASLSSRMSAVNSADVSMIKSADRAAAMIRSVVKIPTNSAFPFDYHGFPSIRLKAELSR